MNSREFKVVKVGDLVTIANKYYGPITFIVIGKDYDKEGTITVLSRDVIDLASFMDNNGILKTLLDRSRMYTISYDNPFGDNRITVSSDNPFRPELPNTFMYAPRMALFDDYSYSRPELNDPKEYTFLWKYTNLRKFLNGAFKDTFSKDVKSCIVPVERITKNMETEEYISCTDSVTLLSATEIGLRTQDEGKIYSYFRKNKDNIDFKYSHFLISLCNTRYNILSYDAEYERSMLLRSTSTLDTTNVLQVQINTSNDAYLEPIDINTKSGIRPVICFDTEKLNSVEYI